MSKAMRDLITNGETLEDYFSQINQQIDSIQRRAEETQLRSILLCEYTNTAVARSRDVIESYRAKPRVVLERKQ